MNINWKLKSCIFRVVDKFNLYKTLYFIQKYITASSRIDIKEINPIWLHHKENLSKIDAHSVIEFGAGKSLAKNIFISYFDKRQTVVDIVPMLDIQKFNYFNIKRVN